MISILIPTYNFDCTQLVQELHEQAVLLTVPFEIIVADDASTNDEITSKNESINQLSSCTFYRETHNLGRAAIRNRLAERAQYCYLLFIDSDAALMDNQFLQRYISVCLEADVICGGARNIAILPSSDVTLRFRYEQNADLHRSALERSKVPYSRFTTFNFLIRKDIFNAIKFDEKCTEYGYEDALFGLELRKRQVSILHIDNPLIHTGLESNNIYLNKTETALRTLYRLGTEMKSNASVSIAAMSINKWHLAHILSRLFLCFRGLLRKNLLGRNPSLFVFKLYKLGFYLTLSQQNKSFQQ
jgi:glycosyltransferase involved in cell wall biosynthesis